MKKQYYKPRKLLFGLLIFGLSMIAMGYLLTMDVGDDVQNHKDIIYVVGWIISIIGMVVGEELLLDASSYDIDNSKQGRKKG